MIPEYNKIILFHNGIYTGLNGLISNGDYIRPISVSITGLNLVKKS